MYDNPEFISKIIKKNVKKFYEKADRPITTEGYIKAKILN